MVAAALPSYLAVVAWVVVVGSVLTAATRLVRTARRLSGTTGPAPADTVAPPPPEDIARMGHQPTVVDHGPGGGTGTTPTARP